MRMCACACVCVCVCVRMCVCVCACVCVCVIYPACYAVRYLLLNCSLYVQHAVNMDGDLLTLPCGQVGIMSLILSIGVIEPE